MYRIGNNIIKNIVVISIIFTLFFMFIISKDTYHIDKCHDDNCSICLIITMAQTMMNIIEGFILLAIIGFVIYFLLSRIKNSSINIKKESLIYQKVQLNE